MVPPVDPGERRQFNVVNRLPWPLPSYEFAFEEPVHRLGEGVVLGRPFRSNRGDRALIGKALRVANGKVLGEFKWSLQRSHEEELQWRNTSDASRIYPDGHPCGPRVDPQRGERTG